MNNTCFLEGLITLKDDPGKKAALRRTFNSDQSRVRGLGLIASLGVKYLDRSYSLPYKAVAFLFGSLKQEDLGLSKSNLGYSLRMAAIKREGLKDGEHQFDRRFDQMVSSTSAESLILNHIIRLPGYLREESINFEELLNDLKFWDKGKADKWIEGYYIWGGKNESL